MIQRFAYLWWRNRRVRRFFADTRRSREIQSQLLLEKIRRHADSQFGRHHGFAQISSVSQFRKQVPVTNYDYYRDYIERLKHGDMQSMFGPGTELLMFAMTSGSTSQSKYVPVTRDAFNEYRDGWNIWGVRTYIDHLDLVNKKTLQLSSDWQQSITSGGTPCGNISGLAAETAPRVSDPIFVLPRSLIKISDTVSKQYVALRLALPSRRVGMIVTANPSTLVEFARLADSRRESLIRDMMDGTLAEDIELPDHLRQSLGPRLSKRHPGRARELEQLADQRGRLIPRDYWPEMSVLAVWTGGSVGAYAPRLKEFYGDPDGDDHCRPVFRDHGLHASEGRMTIPFADGTSAGMLDFVHSFFEFIPQEEHGQDQPNVLEAHELVEGENYYILLTTSGGLYRYDIHDVVRCVGFEGTVPFLEFLNKGSSYSSMTGEKLSEFQVVSAVTRGFGDLNLPIEHFTVAPMFSDPPGYLLLVEEGACSNQGYELSRRIDEVLVELNCEYAHKLKTGRLRSISIREIAPGTWTAFRRWRIDRQGGSIEQYKHPCLVSDLQFIDKLHNLSLDASADTTVG